MDLKELKEKYPNLAALTVEDILVMPYFEEKLIEIIRKKRNSMLETTMSQASDNMFNFMVHNKLWKTENLIAEYLKCINKISGLSATQRNFIRSLCDEAYQKTIRHLM